MSIKSIIKSTVSADTLERIWPLYDSLLSQGVFRMDKLRFKRNYSKSIWRTSQEKLDARLIFHAHSLEKGLSHEKIRYGFGKNALRKLAKVMQRYNELGYDIKAKAYQNALSVLREYVLVHKKASYNTNYLDDFFGDIVTEAQKSPSRIGGTATVNKASKTNNHEKNFEALFSERYSVREYDTSQVDIAKIEQAIEIAMKTPSICNRQTSRVEIITDTDMIARTLKIQGGMTGYDLPPILLVLKTDIRHYVAISERNQPYIDGGLFAMSLLLALEYKGLASCALNAMFNKNKDKSMRELLKTPDNETIIMFIAVGNFKKVTAVPKSFRYRASDITKRIT